MALIAVWALDKRGAVMVGLFGDDVRGPVSARLTCECQLVRGPVVLRPARICAVLRRKMGFGSSLGAGGLKRTLRRG